MSLITARMVYFLFLIQLISSNLFPCVICDNNEYYENYVYNLSQGNWQVRDNSGESILHGENDHSNLTLMVQGPCEVSFKWEVLTGYNYLEFFDNDTSKEKLGKLNPSQLRHGPLNDAVNYSIPDSWQHELKVNHGNNGGRGTAHIYNIFLKDLRISDIYSSVYPDQGVATSKSCDKTAVSNAFNYEVQIDAKLKPTNVELFTLAPGDQISVPQGEGESNDCCRFYWRNIKLKSNEIGLSYYWFRMTFAGVGKSLDSKRSDGPIITNVILDADIIQHILDDYFEDCYYIVINGSLQKRVDLHLCPTNNTDSCIDINSTLFQPSLSNKPIWFNTTSKSKKSNISDFPFWGFELT